MIQVQNISKGYGNLQALSEINFEMHKGEIIGLLGVNGAGKTTLMKILSGIIYPDEGDILFDNMSYCQHASDIKRKLGYLSENNPLYEDMYVSEYLRYIAGLYKIHISKISEIIEKTGLTSESKKKIKTLSKGNKQRVGIAQVLIHDPEFIILDEATSGLDPNQRESLNSLLKTLSEEKIILFSTHVLQDVRDVCNRIICIEKGILISDQKKSDISFDSLEQIFNK